MIAMRDSSASTMLPTWASLAGYEIEAECYFPFHLFLVRPGAGYFEMDMGPNGGYRREERDLVADLGYSPSMMTVWEAVERDAAQAGMVVPHD